MFGPVIAAALRRRRPQPKDKEHPHEMHIKMNGKTYDRWRAVDVGGMLLDILVQERRNQEAAEIFLRRVVEGYPEPMFTRVPTPKSVLSKASGIRWHPC